MKSLTSFPLSRIYGTLCALTAAATAMAAEPEARTEHWVGSWASAQQLPEPNNALSSDDLRDGTLRQVVRLSGGGARLRVRLSNAFGTQPLVIDAVHVAIAVGRGAIVPATDRPVTFGGQSAFTIPAGADMWSDGVTFASPPLSQLAVSMHFPLPPGNQTGHPGSRATSFLVHGNLVGASVLPGAKTVEHWYQLAAIEMIGTQSSGAVVALGDSITDGHGATTDANNRWTDVLATRLQRRPATQHLSVLNEGIGGNRLLLDGLGPNALARFDRDILSQAGARYLIVLEGINDLGTATRAKAMSVQEHAELVQRIIAAYTQIVIRARSHGIRAIGSTITPYSGFDYYHPAAADEADRQIINGWIRTRGHFDAVVDFDRTVRDPGHPERLLPAYDSGDHLHPSAAGYKAMGDSVPLSLFSPG